MYMYVYIYTHISKMHVSAHVGWFNPLLKQ